MLILYLFLLTVGFVFLIYGADKLVWGATQIALKFKMPEILIGLTIVALGTSLPELVISVTSILDGNTGIALGNVVGSNISNILLILGISGIIAPLPINISRVKFDIIISLVGVVAILFFAQSNVISRWEGLILIAVLVVYVSLMFERAKATKTPILSQTSSETMLDDIELVQTHLGTEKDSLSLSGGGTNSSLHETEKNISVSKGVIWIGIGLLGLLVGGKIAVFSATEIAMSLGMSDRLIGLTVIAVGTSLPELVTSVVAVRKGNSDLAIGNIIGSNILNLYFILGATALISPIYYDDSFHFDLIFSAITTLLLLVFMWVGKKKNKLEKWESLILLTLYIWYLYYLIFFT